MKDQKKKEVSDLISSLTDDNEEEEKVEIGDPLQKVIILVEFYQIMFRSNLYFKLWETRINLLTRFYHQS